VINAALCSFSFKLAMRKLMVNKTIPKTNTACSTNKNKTIVISSPIIIEATLKIAASNQCPIVNASALIFQA
jgi:hypothetical protein